MLESEFKLAVMSLVSYKIFQKPKMLNLKKNFLTPLNRQSISVMARNQNDQILNTVRVEKKLRIKIFL